MDADSSAGARRSLSPGHPTTDGTLQGDPHEGSVPLPKRLTTSSNSSSTAAAHADHSNPFLRVRVLASKDSSTKSGHWARTSPYSSFRPPPSTAVPAASPKSSPVSPYSLALTAAAKIRPVVDTRELERDAQGGGGTSEGLNFSMLSNVGHLVSADRGVEWNEFTARKRKGGRPPKRRDFPTGSSDNITGLGDFRTSSKGGEGSSSFRGDVQDEESRKDDHRKLSNWFEGLEDQSWSSEESEEDESLEAKMQREQRELEERKKQEAEKKQTKRRGRPPKKREDVGAQPQVMHDYTGDMMLEDSLANDDDDAEHGTLAFPGANFGQ